MIYLVTNQQSLFELSNEISFGTVADVLQYFKDHDEIEVDTETSGLDCHTDTKILNSSIHRLHQSIDY